MARTKRGSKGAGYDYWSARPGNKGGGHHNPDGNAKVKRQTAKAERQEGKSEARSSQGV